MPRLQLQQMLLRSKLDRMYEDRHSGAIPEEIWNQKSAALQDELRQVRTEMERHEVASQAYGTAGLQILRPRANRLFLVCCEKPARTGAFDQKRWYRTPRSIAEVMRFQDDMSVASIASLTGTDPKRLYRRFSRLLETVRTKLKGSQLTSSDVAPLIGNTAVDLGVLFTQSSAACG